MVWDTITLINRTKYFHELFYFTKLNVYELFYFWKLIFMIYFISEIEYNILLNFRYWFEKLKIIGLNYDLYVLSSYCAVIIIHWMHYCSYHVFIKFFRKAVVIADLSLAAVELDFLHSTLFSCNLVCPIFSFHCAQLINNWYYCFEFLEIP